MSNKKGLSRANRGAFTLIETVVALGILIMVFAGTITLIIAVVNLNMMARNKTEVVANAQEGLTLGVQAKSQSSGGCGGGGGGPAAGTFPNANGSSYTRLVTYADGDYNSAKEFVPAATGPYTKVTATVYWDYKTPYIYAISQIVRKQ